MVTVGRIRMIVLDAASITATGSLVSTGGGGHVGAPGDHGGEAIDALMEIP